MEDDAEQAALVHSLVREVQAIVSSITDDILQEQFVRLYIENGPAGAFGGFLCVGIAGG